MFGCGHLRAERKFSIDHMGRKVKRGPQGRTFGGVAACPHCSAPVRYLVTVKRLQCIVDVVASSYSLPTQPLDVGHDEAECIRHGRSIDVGRASRASTTATERDAFPEAGLADVGAPSDAFPVRGGFDDDEAPQPTQSEMVFR